MNAMQFFSRRFGTELGCPQKQEMVYKYETKNCKHCEYCVKTDKGLYCSHYADYLKSPAEDAYTGGGKE